MKDLEKKREKSMKVRKDGIKVIRDKDQQKIDKARHNHEIQLKQHE